MGASGAKVMLMSTARRKSHIFEAAQNIGFSEYSNSYPQDMSSKRTKVHTQYHSCSRRAVFASAEVLRYN